MTELCEALSTLGVWVRLHYVYPYPHVDELIPLMAAGKIEMLFIDPAHRGQGLGLSLIHI